MEVENSFRTSGHEMSIGLVLAYVNNISKVRFYYRGAAINAFYLKKIGVTHVLNTGNTPE